MSCRPISSTCLKPSGGSNAALAPRFPGSGWSLPWCRGRRGRRDGHNIGDRSAFRFPSMNASEGSPGVDGSCCSKVAGPRSRRVTSVNVPPISIATETVALCFGTSVDFMVHRFSSVCLTLMAFSFYDVSGCRAGHEVARRNFVQDRRREITRNTSFAPIRKAPRFQEAGACAAPRSGDREWAQLPAASSCRGAAAMQTRSHTEQAPHDAAEIHDGRRRRSVCASR